MSDLSEVLAPNRETIEYLADLIVRNKTDPEVLEEMAAVLGWSDAATRLRPSGRVGVRRGDFGEVLAAEAIEAFEGYRVPVRKLRYQMDPEQTLHGTDIVAFKLGEDGSIEELHLWKGSSEQNPILRSASKLILNLRMTGHRATASAVTR